MKLKFEFLIKNSLELLIILIRLFFIDEIEPSLTVPNSAK